MDLLTLKKIFFHAGLALFILVIVGLFYGNNFYFDTGLFFHTLNRPVTKYFAELSLVSTALMAYGAKTPDEATTKKRSKTLCVIGGLILLYLASTLFFFSILDAYFKNAILFFISASVLIMVGVLLLTRNKHHKRRGHHSRGSHHQ